jgi:hypothetical protein
LLASQRVVRIAALYAGNFVSNFPGIDDGFVFIESTDLATASLGLAGGKCERAGGEISRGGSPSAGGAIEAQGVFFTHRGHLHDQADHRSRGRRQARVHDSSTGHGRHHAPGDRARPSAGERVPTRTCLRPVAQNAGGRPAPVSPGALNESPTSAGRSSETGARRRWCGATDLGRLSPCILVRTNH